MTSISNFDLLASANSSGSFKRIHKRFLQEFKPVFGHPRRNRIGKLRAMGAVGHRDKLARQIGFGVTDRQRDLLVFGIWLEGGLKNRADFSAFIGAPPNRFHRLPRAAVAVDFSRFHRQPRVSSAFVTVKNFQRQVERGFEKLRNIRRACAGTDG